MLIKPASGLRIRDPITRDFLPEEGRDVPADDLYWARRLRDGDVVIVANTPEPEKSNRNRRPAE